MVPYIPLFLCWGSFLNVVAYRLVRDEPLTGRSRCPKCSVTIAWYDLIPFFSWLALKGKCRHCKESISPLYPFVELATAILMCILAYAVLPTHFFAYFVLFSALIVNSRSDLETMLISRLTTLCLVPVAFICSSIELLPLTFGESLLGAAGGAAIVYGIAWSFRQLTGQDGLGQGDVDLIALIGAFTGIAGAWWSLTVASILGSCIGISYLLITGKGRMTHIPFGPFLAIGCITYVLFGQIICF